MIKSLIKNHAYTIFSFNQQREWSKSDVNMIEYSTELNYAEEKILKEEIQAGEIRDIESYKIPEDYPYKLKPEEIPLYDQIYRRRIKKLMGNLNR